jgi:2-dehydropantoate 2-reductase
MRYILYGAGAIGGSIGAALFEAGRDVVLIARGEHYRALGARGLRFGTPGGGWRTLAIPVVDHPRALAFDAADVVVLSMQTQDTAGALEALSLVAPPEITIACAQNGVANERIALRRFANVHGMCVRVPGAYHEPGVVAVHAAPAYGVIDVGRYPFGSDRIDRTIATDLAAAQIQSAVRDDIMAQKYEKLAWNVTNPLEAAIGRGAHDTELSKRARAEALAVFAASGISVSSERAGVVHAGRPPVDGVAYAGNSAFQSLARGAGRLEADYLNGEVVLLGRLSGVLTPVNAFLQRLANRLVRESVAPGSLTLADVEASW